MKVIYLGDNRIRGNYGCRGTSTALSQLISIKHEIVGRITGNVTATYPKAFYFKLFPKWFYTLCGKWKKWDKIQPLFARVGFILGARLRLHSWFDFVSDDMEASIKNLKRCLPANKVLKELDLSQYEFDAVVVNGEGSYIFSKPQWREPLVMTMVIYWAQKLGKKVYFMNAMFSDRPNCPRNPSIITMVNNVLKHCEVVVTREDISYDYVKNNFPDVKPILIPDALFTWYDIINDGHIIENGKYYMAHDAESDEAYLNMDFTKPYILVAGSSSKEISKNPKVTVEIYSKIVCKLKEKFHMNVFVVQVCEGDAFLKDVAKITNVPLISMTTPLIAAAKILSNARAFVSGRYHPAIMASLGGTPCVFMGSNSHKTWSLQRILKYDKVEEFRVIPSEEEIGLMINRVDGYLKDSKIRGKIQQRSKELSEEAKTMINLIDDEI